MSYGLRLRIEYKDINEVLTRINICQDGYAGNADIRFAHAGFKADWGDQGGQENPLVYGSSCTVYFDSEFDYEFLYLFSADGRKHRVDIEKAGVLFWTGYIEPDSWNEPLIATPYPVQCTAYDGLGFLQDLPYVPDGRKTKLAILQEILAFTGLSLTLNQEIDWVEAASDALASNIDTEVFEEMTCYEVLEQLFKGCRIYQRGGQWHIKTNTVIAEMPATFESFWFEGSPDMQILPALKQLVVVQDLGYNENLVPNGSFEIYNKELAEFLGWTNISVVPQQRELDNQEGKFVYLPGRQHPAGYGDEGFGLVTNGIKKSLAFVQTTSVIKINLKYALMSYPSASTTPGGRMFIGVRLVSTVTANTYYLRRKPYVLQKEEFEWINLADKPSLGDAHIQLNSSLKKTDSHGPAPDLYYNSGAFVSSFPYDKIQEHFEKFVASVPGIPETGRMEIYLYVPYSERAEIAGACYTALSLEMLDENNEEYPTEATYTIVNSLRNNYVPEELSLVAGDYPDLINNKIIYSGGFRRPNDNPTTGWSIAGGATAYTYAEFIGRVIAAGYSVPRQNYQARLADLIPTDLIVIEDANNPGKRFAENGITYDDRYQAVDGQFSELIAIDIDALTVENTTAHSMPEKPKIISINARPTNYEERVTLIDKPGVKVSTPGYLYENDFEIKQQPEATDDGFVRLQVKRRGIAPYNLDHGAGQLQFSITSVANVNYGGNPNAVRFSAGKFLIHNYNALDKDDRLIALAE